MNQMVQSLAHTGWETHDLYWVGACFFIAHFLWLSPSFLRRKNIIFSLVVMTAFWPLTYTFSIFQIMRIRKQKH
jgi:apolipoprotein N-acyltransferase